MVSMRNGVHVPGVGKLWLSGNCLPCRSSSTLGRRAGCGDGGGNEGQVRLHTSCWEHSFPGQTCPGNDLWAYSGPTGLVWRSRGFLSHLLHWPQQLSNSEPHTLWVLLPILYVVGRHPQPAVIVCLGTPPSLSPAHVCRNSGPWKLVLKVLQGGFTWPESHLKAIVPGRSSGALSAMVPCGENVWHSASTWGTRSQDQCGACRQGHRSCELGPTDHVLSVTLLDLPPELSVTCVE